MFPEPRSATDPLRLAVTLGDPRGIGPEVVPRAVRHLLEDRADVRIVVLGPDAGSDRSFHPPIAGPNVSFEGVGSFDGSLRSAGAVSLDAVRRGVELALAGEVDGLVTGPVHKPALHAAGASYPGQTELLQALTGVERVGMLMSSESTRVGSGPLRILLATTHLPLRDVAARLTPELLEDQVRLLSDSLRDGWGIADPRIALCALNPHASDEGLFGDEEAKIFAPAVHNLRALGVNVTDALPADTVFLRIVDGQADAVAVPYHDVGMAVFKTLAFGRGVNVTLGLPFPRTSPDHGTAFDRVGTGTADHTSSLEALRLAVRLAGRSRRRDPGARAAL